MADWDEDSDSVGKAEQAEIDRKREEDAKVWEEWKNVILPQLEADIAQVESQIGTQLALVQRLTELNNQQGRELDQAIKLNPQLAKTRQFGKKVHDYHTHNGKVDEYQDACAELRRLHGVLQELRLKRYHHPLSPHGGFSYPSPTPKPVPRPWCPKFA
jgi:hypothetical protein